MREDDVISDEVNRRFRKPRELDSANPEMAEAIYHLSDAVTAHRRVLNFWLGRFHRRLMWLTFAVGGGVLLRGGIDLPQVLNQSRSSPEQRPPYYSEPTRPSPKPDNNLPPQYQ